MNKQMEKDWEAWWNNEGSGMPPKKGEEIEEFAKRMTRIAWADGAYIELKRLALLGAHGADSKLLEEFAIRECKTSNNKSDFTDSMYLIKGLLHPRKATSKEVKP